MTNAGCGILSPELAETALGDWHVLQTKPRQEKLLAADLDAMGIHCFLPLLRKVRQQGSRREVTELPMFSGYLFLRGGIDDAYRADRTKRVARLILVSDQRQIHWELNNLRLALSKQAILDPYPWLRVGIRAEVKSGPLRGLQGVIESRCSNDRLILQVGILGRAVSIETHGSLLEPL